MLGHQLFQTTGFPFTRLSVLLKVGQIQAFQCLDFLWQKLFGSRPSRHRELPIKVLRQQKPLVPSLVLLRGAQHPPAGTRAQGLQPPGEIVACLAIRSQPVTQPRKSRLDVVHKAAGKLGHAPTFREMELRGLIAGWFNYLLLSPRCQPDNRWLDRRLVAAEGTPPVSSLS